MQSGDGLSLEAASVCMPTREDGPRSVPTSALHAFVLDKDPGISSTGVNQLVCGSTEKR